MTRAAEERRQAEERRGSDVGRLAAMGVRFRARCARPSASASPRLWRVMWDVAAGGGVPGALSRRWALYSTNRKEASKLKY